MCCNCVPLLLHARLLALSAHPAPPRQAAPSHEVVRTGLAAALTDLGTATKALGDTARGIALYERALAVAPRHADAAYNLAVALAEPGPAHAPDRALFLYHTAAGLRPDCAEA
jgi:tetratricopeptide (TPR) repeat protein